MNLKQDRLNKIKNFLRLQSSGSTVTEIHTALRDRMHLDVSRKTIERDLLELEEIGVVASVAGIPSRFSLNKPSEYLVTLTEEELKEILQVIDPTKALYFKLKNWLST